MSYELTPSSDLEEGEAVQASYSGDRQVYWRAQAWIAAVAMAGGMLILWLIGNPYIWTGAIGGLAAIYLRAWYVASDELGARWDLTDRRLLGPGPRAVRLTNIAALNTIAGSLQVVTIGGDKYLIKHLPDPEAAKAEIEAAKRAAPSEDGAE